MPLYIHFKVQESIREPWTQPSKKRCLQSHSLHRWTHTLTASQWWQKAEQTSQTWSLVQQMASLSSGTCRNRNLPSRSTHIRDLQEESASRETTHWLQILYSSQLVMTRRYAYGLLVAWKSSYRQNEWQSPQTFCSKITRHKLRMLVKALFSMLTTVTQMISLQQQALSFKSGTMNDLSPSNPSKHGPLTQ